MKLKKTLSVLLSAAFLISQSAAAAPEQTGLSLFNAPVTAEAAVTITSGQTGLAYNPQSGVILYLGLNGTTRECSIRGAKLTGTDISLTLPGTITYRGTSFKLTEIEDNAFKNQSNLHNVYGSGDISSNLTRIGNHAFDECYNLEYFSVGNRYGYCSVNSIGNYAFNHCYALSNVNFAKNAEYIGDEAFALCTSLQDIVLDNVVSIGTGAFECCNGANNIDLSNSGLTQLSAMSFYYCANAANIKLPESLMYISTYSLSECCNLETIYIPDSVIQIDYRAFAYCTSLKTVMMSENIQRIENEAFDSCNSMEYFVCKNPNAYIGANAVGYYFERYDSYVPKSNFTIWGKGGRIRTYALNNGFTYRDISEAADIASNAVKPYIWKPYNISSYWAKNGKYYFNSQHTTYNNGHRNETWNGVCAGMAITSVLTARGYLSVSDYARGFSTINNITTSGLDDFTRSYVTTVWANTNTAGSDYSTVLGSTGNNCVFGKEMLRYAEYITYGADLGVITVNEINGGGDDTGHAMVCFGLEFKEYASDKNTNSLWNGKDARILIYNVNNSQLYKSSCLYVNLSDGSWSWEQLRTLGYTQSHCSFDLTHNLSYMINSPLSSIDQFFNAIKR